MPRSEDPFGIERTKRIIDSGVRAVFTPHQPIQARELFFGRGTQVQRLIEVMTTPGQHALLYGDRGVGKSSLANITAELLLKHLTTGRLFVKRCDSEDTFETIVSDALDSVHFFDRPMEHFESKRESGDAGLTLPFAKAGVHTSTEHGSKLIARRINIQPSIAATAINGTSGLLVVDEADALRHNEDKRKLAEFVKQLSDASSPFKLLIVGIADVAADLTAAHPSVQRCLKEIRLERMTTDEVRDIILKGSLKLKLRFAPEAVDRIVDISAGFPYFAHLLCLKCAEEAVAEQREEVTLTNLQTAMGLAVADVEGSMKSSYDAAIRSSTTDNYRLVVISAALLLRDEFTAEELRDSFARVAGEAIEQNAMNNYIQRLVSEDGKDTIMRRVGKGVYRFTDPRMPSYVRIASGRLA